MVIQGGVNGWEHSQFTILCCWMVLLQPMIVVIGDRIHHRVDIGGRWYQCQLYVNPYWYCCTAVGFCAEFAPGGSAGCGVVVAVQCRDGKLLSEVAAR
ncbi:hypothetical protein Nepgr_020434 [Nepenthes gracilis]|uniref:Uncharacterized protein n=1 Tax=Nepenthes gracilis TaxID=150966 RepID=A0AAD3SW30_NEPGR|nr:hypothetical protein Nepgr_020434 [Nepenthes gracilis]